MKKIITLIVFIALSVLVLNTLHHAGSFKTLEPHSELTGIYVHTNMAGPEDIEVDADRGLIFISSSDRWNGHKKEPSQDGIYLLDLNIDTDGHTLPVRLPTSYAGDLHPHGMSILKVDKRTYLYVINHNLAGDFVELFEFTNNMLVHLKSFENEEMCCPNDLVAVDLNKFYVSNDHGAREGLSRTLEDYLRLPNSYILYFDGETYSRAYENLNYANGINVSADGKTLYVAETTGRRLSVLDRDITSGQLQLRFTKDLESGLDNITIDAEGNLWIGSHPKLLDFVAHAENNGKLSPSQVLKLTPSGENDFEVTEVYLNEGEQISGSSTALYHDGKVYIGVVFENKLLVGAIPPP